MIEAVSFKNFRILRDTTLPLKPFTLLLGPNGSGKSTALQAFAALANPNSLPFERVACLGIETREQKHVSVIFRLGGEYAPIAMKLVWGPDIGGGGSFSFPPDPPTNVTPEMESSLRTRASRIRVYSLNAGSIAASVHLQPNTELGAGGGYLAGVLDRLRDETPERFGALNDELSRWLPDFDQILFDTPQQGHRAIKLRTRLGGFRIPAGDLSQGTLFALVLLTLAYLPDPPPVICLEEPDHGIHPRLLRDLRDVLYRLSYPEQFGEKRKAVQVIATTHSPFMLDLYKEHPEEIVLANKKGNEAYFEPLANRPDLDDIVRDTQLGEAWYTGILGGVPADR